MSSSSVSENVIWSQPKKIAFRFFFSYFLLFITFQHNGSYPFFHVITNFLNKALFKFIPWFGKTVFNITYPIKDNLGSGDTTYDYLVLLLVFVVAIISTIIWSLLDRNRNNYKKLYYWLSLSVRFYVGLMLINYGLFKFFKSQFGYPHLGRLNQPYGESSPMGLAWTFLGFSYGYNIFMGIAEVAGIFLLFRRTLIFGVILCLAASANIMAVNYFYDVPVKITTTHLVLMCLFLLAYNFKELMQFFFTKTPTALTLVYKPKLKGSIKKVSLVIKTLIILYTFIGTSSRLIDTKKRYNSPKYVSFLKGFYIVDTFKVNDSIITKSSNDIDKWKYLNIEYKWAIQAKTDKDKNIWFKYNVDSINKKMVLKTRKDSLNPYNFKYREADSLFYLNGTYKGDSIDIKFKKINDYKDNFRLTNRGFRWINETPFNR